MLRHSHFLTAETKHWLSDFLHPFRNHWWSLILYLKFYQLRPGFKISTSTYLQWPITWVHNAHFHVLLMLIITRNNLNAPSICQICLLLFGYKVNCSITFLSFALKNWNKMPQNKKKTLVFIFLNLHGTSNEENEPSLCKTWALIHVLFANDSMVKENR